MALFSNPIVLVLVGVIGLLIGLLIGFLFVDREPRKSSELPQEYTKDGFNEVARMLYSPAKKRIITSLDGQYYRTAGEMTEEKQARLAKVLRLWTEWSKAPAETTEAQQVTIEPVSPAAEGTGMIAETQPESPPGQENPVGEFVSPVEERVEIPPAEEPEGAFESSLFESRLEEMGVSGEAAGKEQVEESEPTPEPEPVKVKNQTIVEQINQELQSLLVGGPYESRGINLQDDQKNGVIVYVGSEKFNSIDSVPYTDVQELIGKAVTEWEHKYESSQHPAA
jgi:hypothetical protein